MSADVKKLRADAARYIRLAGAITDEDLARRFLAMAKELQAAADEIEACENENRPI